MRTSPVDLYVLAELALKGKNVRRAPEPGQAAVFTRLTAAGYLEEMQTKKGVFKITPTGKQTAKVLTELMYA